LNLEEATMKKTYEFETAEKAREVVKKVSEDIGYRFQEMNSIAVAYDGPNEAVIKNGDRLEAYNQKAQKKIEELKQG